MQLIQGIPCSTSSKMMFNYLGDLGEPAMPAFLSCALEHTVRFLLTVLHIFDMNEIHSLLQLKSVPVTPDQSQSGTQSQACQSQVGSRPRSRSAVCPC